MRERRHDSPMSEEAAPRTVSEMLDQLEAGTMTRDEAVGWARTHAWPPVSLRPTPSTGVALFQATDEDPEVLPRESFMEVTLAADMRRIDSDAYKALLDAYVAGQNENRPPPRRR